MLYCVELLPRPISGPIASPSEPTVSESGDPDRIVAEAAAYFKLSASALQLERRVLYLLEFDNLLPADEIRAALQIATPRLFADMVAETANSGSSLEIFEASRPQSANLFNILTVFRPGVTDAVGESVRRGYRWLTDQGSKLPELGRVRTATLYRLSLSHEEQTEVAEIAAFVRSHLVNELVQEFVVYGAQEYNEQALADFLKQLFSPSLAAQGQVRTIALREANETELLRLSNEGLLALDLIEMQVIQSYFQEEGRDPTDVELETLAQTWSEHCIHKTFKARINYVESSWDGHETRNAIVDGLFKTCIVEPTEKLAKPWVTSVFSDNAGIIGFDRNYEVSFKVETHNHPSALEPFGGANTGLGGVIRDVMAVSAKPIAATDIFCFGPPDTPPENVPPEVLPPDRIFRGVVDGVRDYGNKMGIPTVNGAVLFDRGYLANPLVFCGTVGLAPRGSHPRNVQTGDRIVVLGGRTGRDGVHGATFSSIELGGTHPEQKLGSVVQIGNPIEEKKTLDLLLKARDKRLYTAITDCGAGGLSSAIGEMGEQTGAQVELERVPLKYEGLEPWEIWVSEAQERMVLAVAPDKLPALLELCKIEDVEATDLGEFTNDGLLTLNYAGQRVGQLKMTFLHKGVPRRELSARWRAPEPRPLNRRAHYEHHRPYLGYSIVLERILADPNVSSKESVIRVYDYEVQGNTVVKPLVGVHNDGPSDATVLKPFPDSVRGLVISNGINPRYGLLDPYHMAACAIDEAIRNAVAVGANLERMALLDNFCWGNPKVPERLGELVRAAEACRDYAWDFGLPFISGKDSLNNEYRDPATGQRLPIPGTLLISAIAVMEDVSKAVTLDLKQPGNLIYIIGRTRPELGGGYYAKYHGQIEGDVPTVQAGSALRGFRALNKAIKAGLVRSCHDLSEGGLAVAAAEMAFSGGLGIRLDLLKMPYEGAKVDRTNAALLFSETPSRFLVEVEPSHREEFENALRNATSACIGTVIADDEMYVGGLSSATVLRVRVSELKAAWQTPLI
ncbi:MAG: phosphoribosylformylglycinamidine synthase subunit PurL [Chloroflexota bacterium]